MFIVRECRYVCGRRKGSDVFFPHKNSKMRLGRRCLVKFAGVNRFNQICRRAVGMESPHLFCGKTRTAIEWSYLGRAQTASALEPAESVHTYLVGEAHLPWTSIHSEQCTVPKAQKTKDPHFGM